MNSEKNPKGTWGMRSLVIFFSVILGALIYWLLGFILSDLDTIPGPDLSQFEERTIQSADRDTLQEYDTQIATLQRQISQEQAKQRTLRDSTTSSQMTMNQLVELQKFNLQKGATPSEEERNALADSEKLFLTNQREYQRLNEQIFELEEQVRGFQQKRLDLDAKIAKLKAPAFEEYQKEWERHRLRIAMSKLAILIPLLLLGMWLYFRYRTGTYWSVVYAYGIALLVKIGFVMHEYFPARYFKYILIATMLAITLRVLMYILSAIAHPKRDTLLKQYREAYESFFCPICSHPIRRGPLKFMAWTRSSLRRMQPIPGAADQDEPYTCPACSTSLYAPCPKCNAIRHTLLPACTHCGDVRDIESNE
ncbi:MAG: hypothetical protein U0905_19025 [Pirellulales bacterium]